MHIGDKVRFLNEVGGGVVTAFPDAHTVLVQDEDGFEIPMLVKDCVVVEQQEHNKDYNKPKTTTAGAYGSGFNGGSTPGNRFRAEKPDACRNAFDDDEDETTKCKPGYGKGSVGATPDTAVAFVTQQEPANGTFGVFVVNDSPWTIDFILTKTTRNGICRKVAHEMLDPFQKIEVATINSNELNDMAEMEFFALKFKNGKEFDGVHVLKKKWKIDPVRFGALKGFVTTPFFMQEAWLVDVNANELETVNYVSTALKATAQNERSENSNAKRHTVAAQYNKNKDLMEVDLHAAALLDSTEGLPSNIILERQLQEVRNVMNDAKKIHCKKIVFIHGKGEGVLRKALLNLIKKEFKQCSTQDASFCEYGFGATLVTRNG